jgi:hypothetical protein
MNDLPNVVANTVRIFADDTKLYVSVRNEEDRKTLQDDINRLSDWPDPWLIKFNTSKCSVIHLGHNNPKYDYDMRDNSELQKLEQSAVEKDLGVYVDNKLFFH